jgi:hypothetical protein
MGDASVCDRRAWRDPSSLEPVTDEGDPPFESLDFLYTPSEDVASDVEAFERLGALVVFAIESNGTRVAALRLDEEGPLILFADHLDGERAIAVHRVSDLDASLTDLERRGWVPEHTFEIPQGPCATFRSPTGHRLAVYQQTRPEVGTHLEGRRDY